MAEKSAVDRFIMGRIEVRKANPADAQTVLALYSQAREKGKSTGSCDWSDDYPNEQTITEDIRNSSLFLFVDHNELVAAFSILETDDLDDEPLGWTPVKHCVPVRICVSPDHQGKGIGKKAMAEIIKIARSSGCGSLRLLASVQNIPANSLYLSLGFVHKGRACLYGATFNAYEYVIGTKEMDMLQQTNKSAAGIETAPQQPTVKNGAGSGDGSAPGPVHSFAIPSQHLRLTQVVLADGSDRNNELVQELQWLLHPSNGTLSLQGNLFLLEDLAQDSGRIFIKCAPLPNARPIPSAWDLQVAPVKGGGFTLSLFEEKGSIEPWTVLEYSGGCRGRTRAMQDWQRDQRPKTRGHLLPRFLSNTWGDRSRDSRMNESFVMAEIAAARKLGVDVVQLDDGWQRGTTANSAKAKELGGVWEGFWNADPQFWTPHPERFPRGLEPVVAGADAVGIKLGLWFAPDSWNDFAAWRRDADRVLELFDTLGIEHFKIDGVKATTETARRNLRAFFSAVLEGSRGSVVFDLDITAGIRPGYFGAMEVGPLFVENRYTDWRNYWPHSTLRNLWMLSRWIDPLRLRMEFLNNARNTELYADDPLAPARYAPDALFAMVMFSNPLGWFEASNLPEAYVESCSALVRIWKAHREDLFSGTMFPIGQEPDGYSYTGFMSLSPSGDHGYVVLFRELHGESSAAIPIPSIGPEAPAWELLSGEGTIAGCGASLQATIPKPLGFVFARFAR